MGHDRDDAVLDEGCAMMPCRLDAHATGDALPRMDLSVPVRARSPAPAPRPYAEGVPRAILDSSRALISLKDLEGRYLFVNRQFEAVVGVGRDEVVGRTDDDLFPEGTAALFRAN